MSNPSMSQNIRSTKNNPLSAMNIGASGVMSHSDFADFNSLASAPGGIGPHNEIPAWVQRANEQLGQRDIPGPKYNPRVAEYLKTTGLQDNSDETSWCSAFVNWCFTEVGIKGTNDASARSWLKWGSELNEPEPGCVVVLWRESRESWKGHVGFFDGWDVGQRVRLLAGNQGGGVDWDEVCVATFPKERILSFRWPVR